MRPLLDDSAVVHDENRVGVADGREAVRDDERRSALELAKQQLADTVLTSPIDGAVRERRASAGVYRDEGIPSLKEWLASAIA